MGARGYAIVGLLFAELAALDVAYQFLRDFECPPAQVELACWALRSSVPRAAVAAGAFLLVLWVRRIGWPEEEPAGVAPGRAPGAGTLPALGLARARWWMLLHFAGLALMLAPLAQPARESSAAFLHAAVLPWTAGAACAATGVLFWLAPGRAWARWLAREGYVPLLLAGLGFLLPDVAGLLLPLWDWQPLTAPTFAAVRAVLSLGGGDITSDPAQYILGLDGFYVQILRACSGTEGLILVTAFVIAYGVLLRRSLRFPHFWLVLPLGLALSWLFNVARIAALVWIGARVSPDLAVNGFHTYAGWMFFTLLAMGLVVTVQAMPWFRASDDRPPARRLTEDWTAARILPLIVLLLTGTVGLALSPQPDLVLAVRTVTVGLALAAFWRSYVRLPWTRDPVALAAGLAVGVLWLVFEPSGSDPAARLGEALAGWAPAAAAAWLALRLIGTALVVPLAEELFFRGYLLGKLDFGGPLGRAFALLVSSALFAALHSRWLDAWVAGMVFALVLLRRHRLGDAVIAHVAANGVVALALLAGTPWDPR